MRRDAFQAIADPTRREIIAIIAQGPSNLNAIADHFKVTRPAISKQVKILAQCGLLVIKQRGRERVCEANLQSLSDVTKWIEHMRAFWTHKLDALEHYLSDKAVHPTKKRPGITAKNKKTKP